MANDKYTDIFFSFDVEASGPNSAEYSMISLGMVACATYDGKTFTRLDMDDPADLSFYSLIREHPDRQMWSHAAAGVHGIDRKVLAINGYDPGVAMQMCSEYVRRVAGNRRPVAVAYPLGFDWPFLYNYFCEFTVEGLNPFGFSGCLDIKTMYAVKARTVLINSTKRQMPKKLRSTRAHTHNALDDAKEQAELFCNIFEWDGNDKK